ncbi:MAG: hypothetical protein NTU94_04285, partial [Planctomycetota bacterium]|nr:hypothetical protein [Planctomycetota bacterium]
MAALCAPDVVAGGETQAAGDAGDNDPFTFTARFPCAPEEVPTAYGRKFAILVDGVDACSWEYARVLGFSRPRRPLYQDLSDQAGWPRVHVQSGTVAIDPKTGRFRFAEGDTTSGIERKHFVMTPHGMAHLPVVRGRVMLCPNGETWSGIRVVDISDPARAKDLMTLDVGCFGARGAELGNRMYCHANYNGTTILDITDPSHPTKIGHWRVPPPAHHGGHVVPFRIGEREYFYCFVKPEGGWKDWPKEPSEPKPGLRLVEVTNPARPAAKHLGLDFMFAAANGHHAYHAAKAAMEIYDITNPESPRQVGTVPGSLDHLAFAEDRLYASRGDALAIFDNSDPAAPREIGRLGGLRKLNGIAVRGGHAYVVTEGNTLAALDISEASAVKRLGSATVPRTHNCASVALTLDGKVAVVPDAGEGFGHWLFDLTDPAQPRQVGRHYSAGEIQHLLVSGGLATASLEWGGVQAMLDVSDPLKMRIVGFYHSGRFDDYADACRGEVIYFGKGRSKTVV